MAYGRAALTALPDPRHEKRRSDIVLWCKTTEEGSARGHTSTANTGCGLRPIVFSVPAAIEPFGRSPRLRGAGKVGLIRDWPCAPHRRDRAMFARRHRIVSFAPAVLLLATVIGAGSVLAGIGRDGSASLRPSIAQPPSAVALGQPQDRPSDASRDCKNLIASFLNSACHSAEPRKLHAGHLTHRLATVVVGQADTRETDPADDRFPRPMR